MLIRPRWVTKSLYLVIVLLLTLYSLMGFAQVQGYDRFSMRDIYIIAVTDSDNLLPGTHIVIQWPDTGESQTVEVLRVSELGTEIELEVYFAAQNTHYIFEMPRDGISSLFR